MFIQLKNYNSFIKVDYAISSDSLILSYLNDTKVEVCLYELKNHRDFISTIIDNKDKEATIEIKYDSNTTLVIDKNKIVYHKVDNNDRISLILTSHYSNILEYLKTLFKDIVLYWNNPIEFIYKYSNSIECQ